MKRNGHKEKPAGVPKTAEKTGQDQDSVANHFKCHICINQKKSFINAVVPLPLSL